MTATAYERVLRALAGAGEAGSAPGDLPRLSSVTDTSSCRRAVRQAVERGHARRDDPRGRIYVTTTGLAAVAQPRHDSPPEPAATPPAPADNGVRLSDIDAAITLLPLPLQIMVRWLLAAALFRHHCRTTRPDGHPGGIAAGNTGIGKTLVACVVGQALGLVDFIVEPARQPDGALFGRTMSRPGGQYEFTPAEALARPFLCIDELGDAAGPKQVAALRLLQGETRITVDGQPADVACTPYATTNKPLGTIPASRRRRSLCLDGASFPPLPYDVAAAVLAAVPRLPYEHLTPPAANLDPAILTGMRQMLEACLTPAGMQLLDLRGLEAVVLGHAAAAGTSDLAAVALEVVTSYLICGVTTGTADRRRLGRLLTGQPDAQADEPEPAQPARARQDSHADKLAVIGAAGTVRRQAARIANELTEAAEDAPPDLQAAAGGVVDQLQELRRELKGCRHRADLEEIGADALQVLSHAAAITAEARTHTAYVAAADGGVWATSAIAGAQVRLLQQQDAAPAISQDDGTSAIAANQRRALPAGDVYAWPLKRAGVSTPPAAAPSYRPLFQPAWRAPARVPPSAPRSRPGTAGDRHAAYIEAACGAADTTAGDFIRAESMRRQTAGEPPLTDSELITIALHRP